jgi:imidazolonepropionase-like amidohydrolase
VPSPASMVLGLLVTLGAAAGAAAQQPAILVIRHANVITGSEPQPIPDATVIVRDGKIVRVATGAVEAPPGATVLDLAGKYLLPGLIDAHVHIADFAAAKRALLSGVTTVRSMGVSNFVDVGMRALAAQGDIDAPEFVAAGYHIRPRPAPTIFTDAPELGDLLEPGLHGPDALRRAVRVMVQHHVQWIKVLATERAGTPETDPRKQVYSEEELRAIVEEAAKAGLPVAAHAHGEEGAHAAVVAGVRSIEHGTFLADSTLALMARKGTFLVPTLAIEADLAEPGGDYDDPGLQIRGRFMRPRALEMAARAHKLGVKLVTGTDTGYGPESVTRLSQEIEALVGVGLTPFAALQAATTVAADLIGVSDHTGHIAPGLDADLIAVERNPLEDIRTIEDVLLVVNNGKVVLNRLTW